MAEYTDQPPSFPGVAYTAGTMNIGQGYAAGISQAGEGIAKGIGAALDVATQNRNVDDTLQAMNQSKILPDEAYKAVAGKSLGAKQTMLGMYASQWIQQQAQNRELQKLGYQGNVQLQVAHGELLDKLSLIKAGYGQAVGINPQKMPIGSTGQAGQPAGAPAVQRAQLVQNPTAANAARAASLNPNLAGTPANPQPLGTDVSQPGLIIGNPIGMKENIPPGAKFGVINGQRGFMMPDNRTFLPLKPTQTVSSMGIGVGTS